METQIQPNGFASDRQAIISQQLDTPRRLQAAVLGGSTVGISNTIDPLAETINARQQEYKDVILVVNEESGSIHLKCGIYGMEDVAAGNDPRNINTRTSLSLTGTLELHSEFEDMLDLCRDGAWHEVDQLGRILQARKRNFVSPEQHAEVVERLKNFSASVATDYERVRNEGQGKVSDVLKRAVNANPFKAFGMQFRIVKGGKAVKSEFWIGMRPSATSVQVCLMNYDLDALREVYIQRVVREELEAIKKLLPSVPVVNE